jgi:AraC-like DNA-binding protein
MADGLKSDCIQLEAGTCLTSWNVLRLPSMVVQYTSEQMAVARHLRVADDRWALVVPLVVPGPARWNGCAVTPGDLVVCAPRSEGYAFEPRGMMFAVVSVAPSEAPGLVSAAVAATDAADSCVVHPEQDDVSALRSALIDAGAETIARRSFEAIQCARRLVNLLIECLSKRRAGLAGSRCGPTRVVGRAEEFLREHVGEPISIAQLSTIVEVSERSLRNAFHRVFTTSPKRYLRLWQLHQVRRALQTAVQPQQTVTDIATFHGFYELGRFAGEYKALFGEVPSQTLRSRTRELFATGH